MSIKNKLLGLVILIGFSFIIVVIFSVISLNIILEMKKIELHSSEILTKWGALQSSSKALLISKESLESLEKKFYENFRDFDKTFTLFQKYKKKILISNDIKSKINNSNKVWLIIKENLLDSAGTVNEIITLVKSDVFYNNLDNKSLLQIFYAEKSGLKLKDDKNEFALFMVLVNKLLETDGNIDYTADVFNKLIKEVNKELIVFLNSFIKIIFVILTLLSLIIISTSVLIAYFLSINISNKVIKIEDVMKHIAEKDFSANLTISGDDELSKLSININKTIEIIKSYIYEIERSNSELQQFAYVASHDLQEPLRKISIFGGYLKKSYRSKLDDDGFDYLERMLNASLRMQNLINDLLAYSRISTEGKQHYTTDLNIVVSGVLIDLETSIETNKAKIDLSILPVIDAEPTQMRQLFQNFIGNALKFHKKETPPLIKIYQHAEELSGSCLIIIEDNGIGIEEKNFNKIFGVFQKLHGKNEYEGSGIGLSVCKKIIENHRGTVKVESKIGEGTKFIISLPLKQSDLK